MTREHLRGPLPYQIPTKPRHSTDMEPFQHLRGEGRCHCLGVLMDCPTCKGKRCVHRIFETGESHCENGVERGCNRPKEPQQ